MLPLYRISDWRNGGAFVYALVIGKVVGYRTTHGDWRVALVFVLVYWDILFLPQIRIRWAHGDESRIYEHVVSISSSTSCSIVTSIDHNPTTCSSAIRPFKGLLSVLMDQHLR